MKILDILAPDAILPAMRATTKSDALQEIATLLATLHPEIDGARLGAGPARSRGPRQHGDRRGHRHPARQDAQGRQRGGRLRAQRMPGSRSISLDGKPTRPLLPAGRARGFGRAAFESPRAGLPAAQGQELPRSPRRGRIAGTALRDHQRRGSRSTRLDRTHRRAHEAPCHGDDRRAHAGPRRCVEAHVDRRARAGSETA